MIMKTVLTRLKIKIKIGSKIKKKIRNTFEKRSWNYVLNNSSQRVDIPCEKHINKCKKIEETLFSSGGQFSLIPSEYHSEPHANKSSRIVHLKKKR